MVQLAYNANGLRKLPLEHAIEAVAAADYDAIELSLHPNHLDPFDFDDEDAEHTQRWLRDAGITACCLATGTDTLLSDERFEPSLITAARPERRRRIDLIRRAIDIARALDVPIVNFASGIRRADVAPEAAWDLLVDGVTECLSYASGDLVLAIEPEPGFFVETNDAATHLIRTLGNDHFRVNQDIGHVNVSEDDYLESIARTLPLTAHMHVEDIKARRHYHEIPGDGDIDFRAFFEILRRGDYDGYISVELYNHVDVYEMALRRSRDHLRSAA